MAVETEPMTDEQRAAVVAIIARQNDQFRAAMPLGGRADLPGRLVCTTGIAQQGAEFLFNLQMAVAAFSDFSEDNDPWGDHTFGVITLAGVKVFWKIDLYDENCEYGSDEPENPERTHRVLTLLLPSEY